MAVKYAKTKEERSEEVAGKEQRGEAVVTEEVEIRVVSSEEEGYSEDSDRIMTESI